MDFGLSEDQKAFRRSVLDFAQKELACGNGTPASIRRRDKSGEFYREGWDKVAAFGLLGLPLPEAFGGLGKGIVDAMIAMQALGRGCQDAGLLFSISSHIFTCEIPILGFGSAAQKKKFLPRLARGEIIGCHAMTEPGAGSDAFSIQSTAEHEGDRWILRGAKTFTSNAPIADLFIVFATTNKKKGWAGVTAFLVERGAPGLTVGRPLEKMGLKTSPTAELTLDAVEVDDTAVLGKVGMGSAIFNAEMEWERSCLFAIHLGAMQRQLDRCVEHAKTREQFGKPIGSFQAISHKLADMRVRIELGELILHKVAWLKEKGERAPLESAIAKLFVSESFVQNSLDAVQIHGGYGYMAEYDVERDVRDAIGGKLYSGTSEIQRNIIASLLGL